MPKKRGGKSNIKKVVHQEVVKQIKKQAEPKNHYTSQVRANLGFAGTITNLSNPGQGDTSQLREGDRCQASSIEVRGSVASATTAGGYNVVRVMLIRWKEDTAVAVPVLGDILQATYAGAAWTPMSPLVVGVDRKRFTMLYDRTFMLDESGARLRSFHIRKKLNHKLYFNATATTGSNQLYLITVSDDGVTTYPQDEWISNFTFRDI